jgi:hypothetical protein
VSNSVDDYAIVVGNPARVVGERGVQQFQYFPSRQVALFEAWLGPASSGRAGLGEAEYRAAEPGGEYACSNGPR